MIYLYCMDPQSSSTHWPPTRNRVQQYRYSSHMHIYMVEKHAKELLYCQQDSLYRPLLFSVYSAQQALAHSFFLLILLCQTSQKVSIYSLLCVCASSSQNIQRAEVVFNRRIYIYSLGFQVLFFQQTEFTWYSIGQTLPIQYIDEINTVVFAWFSAKQRTFQIQKYNSCVHKSPVPTLQLYTVFPNHQFTA